MWFERPISSRNLANFVEDDVVDALLKAVQTLSAYLAPLLQHKGRWFGRDRLDYWDRNAPPPDKDERVVSWETARETVLGAYGDFSGKLAEIGGEFFEKPWIDAPVRPGKSSGAFAHPTVPSAHPYLLLNYQGKTRDVDVGARVGTPLSPGASAGQGLWWPTRRLLSRKRRGFRRMLTFKRCYGRQTTASRAAMLAGKIEI